MGRYLLGDHVWSIEREPTLIRIVEDGVERIEKFADAATASLRFTILTNHKMRAGWKLEREPARAPAAKLPKQPDVFDARNPDLEAAIIADPDSDDAWMIYGDWLQQQGDPRGEMIARCAAAKLDVKQLHRVGLRENAYQEYFYGGMAKALYGMSLRWGFVHIVQIRRDHDVHTNLKTVLTNDAARMVGEIYLATSDADDFRRALKILVKYAPPTLRTLGLESPLADLSPIMPLLPKLHGLTLPLGLRTNLAIQLPQLRMFEARLEDDQVASMLGWIDTSMPRLVDLRLFANVDLEMLERARFAERIETLRLEGDPERIVALFPKLRRVFGKFGTNHAVFRERGIAFEEDDDDRFDDVDE